MFLSISSPALIRVELGGGERRRIEMEMEKCGTNLIRFILSYGSECAACEAQSSDLSLGALETPSSSL